MANLSDAWGTIVFPKEFEKKHGKLISEFAEMFQGSGGDYGFCYIDDNALNDKGEHELDFSGTGRWTFCDTLKNSGIGNSCWYTFPEGETLREALAKEKSDITVHFTDYEPGCGEFYEMTMKLAYKNKDEFDYVVVESTDIPVTDRNIMTICEREGYDMKLPEERRELLQWLIKELHLSATKASKFISLVLQTRQLDGCILEETLDFIEDQPIFENLLK